MLSLLCAGMTADASVAGETSTKARRLREDGLFKQAETFIATTMKRDAEKLSADERKQLLYEIDLMERIRQDFSLTKEELLERLKKSVRDFKTDEFESWLKEGRFEGRMIDGVRQYAGTSVSNLYWRYPELNSRRRDFKDKTAYYQNLLANCRAIKKAAAEQKKSYVMPTLYRLTMSVTVDKNTVPDGKTIRAWLPIPRKYPYPFQQDFRVVSSSPDVKSLAEETSTIRSAYFEQPAEKERAAKFSLTYEFTGQARCFRLDPDEVEPFAPNDPVVKQFTSEGPHVVFTDKVKALGAKIVGSETNLVRKARAIYDWVADNLKYSFALEYSTIPNISDYSIERNYGDCGQQALVFITLCRQQGIPARWQSGWYLFPGAKNIHDWSEIYLPPWGWVPVDPEFGNAVMRYATMLTAEERQELHDFYFGGLDQYRMAANSDHSQELQPPKKTWRSDDVDFQRGELEAGTSNIYFDKYNYDMQIEQTLPQ